MLNDIFESCKFSDLLPDNIYIVGFGHSLHGEMVHVPRDGFQVVLNGAITQKGINPDIWLVADEVALKCEWFSRGLGLKTTRIFSENLEANVCQEGGSSPYADYTFKQGRELTTDNPEPVWGYLRHNGTVFAQALQLAFFAGCRVIKCAGVPFWGNNHADGTLVPGKEPGMKWGHLGVVNALLRYLRAQGSEIYTLGDTALDMEVYSYERA